MRTFDRHDGGKGADPRREPARHRQWSKLLDSALKHQLRVRVETDPSRPSHRHEGHICLVDSGSDPHC